MQSNSSQIVTCSRQQSMEERNFAMAVLWLFVCHVPRRHHAGLVKRYEPINSTRLESISHVPMPRALSLSLSLS